MNEQRISWGGQVRIYLGKLRRLFVHEKHWKNFISTLLIILIISAVTSGKMFSEFRDTKNGAFAIICACIWIGLFNSIQSVCRERAIVKREHRTGLRISSYIVAHVIYELFLCAVESLIVLSVVLIKNRLHLPPSGLLFQRSVDLYLVLFHVTFSADMIALLISCIVKSENTAMTVMPFVLIIQLVMSGSIFELQGLSKLVSYITLSKWGLDGICAIANTSRKVWNQCRFNDVEGCDPTGKTLLVILLVLLLFSVVYIAAAILALRTVDRDER